MPTFDERVQALPPELYQEIYDLTFTPTSTEVFVTKEYQPPALLRINQATREKFANSYYGENTIFNVDTAVVQDWLKSLADAKIQIKSEIRMKVPFKKDLSAWTFLRGFRFECSEALTIDCSPEFKKSVATLLRIQVTFGEPARTVWMSRGDLPDVWGSHLIRMSATAWCEGKFGRAENVENVSSENTE